MKLVIAEKPSVAQSLAKVLGATNKKDGYMEGKNNRSFSMTFLLGNSPSNSLEAEIQQCMYRTKMKMDH